MKYKHIKGLDKEVSRIIFGSAGKEFIAGNNQSKLLDEVLASGINIIDTARNYGLSEKSIGLWFKESHKRNEVILLSKCGHPDTTDGRDRINEKEIREDLETSLSLLNTDYLDIYLLHRDDLKVNVEEIVEIMNTLYKEGKICLYGVSNWTIERIKQANDYADKHNLLPINISSPNYCVANKVINPWLGECVSLCGNKIEKDYYKENQMPIFAYSSLGRGFFSGKVISDNPSTKNKLDEFAIKSFYNDENLEVLKRLEELANQKKTSVSTLALSWLLNSNLNVFPIVSCSNINSINDNLAALNLNLSKAELDYINIE